MKDDHSRGTVLVIAVLVAAPALASQVRIGAIELLDEWSDSGVAGSPLDHPMAVAASPTGTILVADSNSRIISYGEDGAPRSHWQLPAGSRPVGLVGRADGTVLVADYTGDRVLVLGGDGRILEI